MDRSQALGGNRVLLVVGKVAELLTLLLPPIDGNVEKLGDYPLGVADTHGDWVVMY